jgi:putative Holliday junction resolvase
VTSQSPGSRAHLILGFDFGLRRIGVAAADSINRTARPLKAVACRDTGADWPAIERLLTAHAPEMLVVGSPYNADGTPGALSRAADQFAAALGLRARLPVARVDERYSSLEANAQLSAERQSGQRRRRVRREDIDSGAAAIILQRWLAGET